MVTGGTVRWYRYEWVPESTHGIPTGNEVLRRVSILGPTVDLALLRRTGAFWLPVLLGNHQEQLETLHTSKLRARAEVMEALGLEKGCV